MLKSYYPRVASYSELEQRGGVRVRYKDTACISMHASMVPGKSM